MVSIADHDGIKDLLRLYIGSYRGDSSRRHNNNFPFSACDIVVDTVDLCVEPDVRSDAKVSGIVSKISNDLPVVRVSW